MKKRRIITSISIKISFKIPIYRRIYTYKSRKDKYIQIFIPVKNMSIESAYKEINKIEQILEAKSSKRCKILPDINLPKNYNKITLPIKKM